MLSAKVNNILAKLQFTIPAEVMRNATNLETNVNEEMCEKGHDSDGNPLVGIIRLNKKSKENGLHLLLTGVLQFDTVIFCISPYYVCCINLFCNMYVL